MFVKKKKEQQFIYILPFKREIWISQLNEQYEYEIIIREI